MTAIANAPQMAAMMAEPMSRKRLRRGTDTARRSGARVRTDGRRSFGARRGARGIGALLIRDWRRVAKACRCEEPADEAISIL
jgi:hypothetical protein